MARPQKTGLDYFSFDTNFFSDKKIKILKARYGNNGIITFIYLLSEIYRNGYYIKWDEDYKFLVAEELNLTDGFIEQVLTFLLERSLLNSKLFKSDTILTSPGIQRRYQEAVKMRGQKKQIEICNYWLLDDEDTATYIKVTQNDDNSKKNDSYSRKNDSLSTEEFHKVKESKVNENINIYMLVVDYLNERCNTRFQGTTIETIKLILDKISRGFTLEDFKYVIDIKAADWMGTEREKFLRPSTLFGDKFESYRNEKPYLRKDSSTDKYNSFPQRVYSNEEFNIMEQQLLNKE